MLEKKSPELRGLGAIRYSFTRRETAPRLRDAFLKTLFVDFLFWLSVSDLNSDNRGGCKEEEGSIQTSISTRAFSMFDCCEIVDIKAYSTIIANIRSREFPNSEVMDTCFRSSMVEAFFTPIILPRLSIFGLGWIGM